MSEDTCKGCPEKQITSNTDTKRLGWGVRHIQAACMCVCVTSLFMVRSSMGVAILAMTDRRGENENITVYDWDKNTQGVILSSFFWGYVVMQVPAGVLSKRFGGKAILLAALLINTVISLLLPVFASLGGWQLTCAARVVTGLAQACTFPASHTLLGRWFPDHERVMLSGFVYSGSQLGTILGMPISGWLAGTTLGWPLVFYAMAAQLLAVAALWHFLTASTPGEHRFMTALEREYIEKGLNTSKNERRVRTPWRQILTARPLWGIVLAHIGCAYGFVLFFVDLPTFLEKGLNISMRSSAILSALPYIGMWAGGLFATSACERVYNKGLLSGLACRKIFNTIGAVGISVGLVGLAFTGPGHTTLAIVWLVAALTFSGFCAAGFMVNHLDLSPNFAGLLLSLTNFIANIVCVFVPILTSFLLQNDPTDLSRWRIVFLVAAGMSVVTNVVYVMFGSAELQPWDDPDFLDKKVAQPEEMNPVLTQEPEKPEKSEKDNNKLLERV
ncbi:putative inorganic phosphate cotransporter [Pectinophora gossypiella]|uniref:putative inorganic phosphate cotransporter n=1 Tax=Pectinophora gossypiella TaxID=13191 RepID=UPI00214E2C7E|nr:putative inorganic phosphate cotransporter [Pectinophora gossypiella]XP_049886594.1 putative inorganic phosphate cotransporter [Pectinophora gossypiella]